MSIRDEVKILGKFTVESENREIRKNLNILNTEQEDKKPLLGIKWLRGFKWRKQNIQSTTHATDKSKTKRIITNFEMLFKTNRTIKDTEKKIRLEKGHPQVKKKARNILYHLHS